MTAGDVLGAVLLGFGTATTIALNIGVRKSRGTNTSLTVTGNVAAIVPTLFCTSLFPSGLVLIGASAPVIEQRFQRFQAFFANDSAQFVGIAVAVVLFSLWLAIGNLATACKTRSSPE